MFLTESFPAHLDDLLARICAKLQLTTTQHALAETRYTAIGKWLEEDPGLAVGSPTVYPQGSLLIGTTVRPRGSSEYDLDLVCELQIDWRRIENPVVLLDAIERRIRDHEVYRYMLERKNRCIRLNYKGEFHLDILPGCHDVMVGGTNLRVPDRKAKDWKASNPKGFGKWFDSEAQNYDRRLLEKMAPLPGREEADEKPPLKLAVQLMKRWRDIFYEKTPDIAPISIVLTTLGGMHHNRQASVAEALRSILDGIAGSLPGNGARLHVFNPSNPQEDLSERWDDSPHSYEAFVRGIEAFNVAWYELLAARGPSLSNRLSQLFGEDLAASAVREQVELLEKSRKEGTLGVRRGSGVIIPAALGTGVVPVRRNTFFGA